MTSLARGVPWLIAATALVVGAISMLYAVEAGSVLGDRPISILPMALAYDVRAEKQLEKDPLAAERLSRKALAIRPVDGRAWLTLAMVQMRRTGRLGPAGTAALQRSYDSAPYDPTLLADRAALAYDGWSELPADIREEVQSEIRAAWPYPRQQQQLMAAALRARTPRGRMALALELFRMRVQQSATGASRSAGAY